MTTPSVQPPRRRRRNPNGRCLTPACGAKATEPGAWRELDPRPAWCGTCRDSLAEIRGTFDDESKQARRSRGTAVRVRKMKPQPRRELTDEQWREAILAVVEASGPTSRAALGERLGVGQRRMGSAVAALEAAGDVAVDGRGVSAAD